MTGVKVSRRTHSAGAANASGSSSLPAKDSQEASTEDVQKAFQDVQSQARDFEALGFKRLHLRDVEAFWYATAPWGPPKNRLEGRAWLGNGLTTLSGWLITVLLLSAGAPFWEDILESLFGLKDLVRQKTATKNAEEGAGGQPKP